MESWAVPRRAWAGALASVGLGFVAGSFEMVALAASQSLALSFVQFAMLGVVAMVLMGALGFAIGAVTSPLHLLLHRARPSTALSAHLTLTGFLLCGYYMWQAAARIYTDERAPAAFAMAAMPLGFTGVVYFNARYFLRRAELGRGAAVPWLPAAFGLGAFVVGVAGAFQALRDTGGPHALADDRNVLFVTVGGWSQASPALEARFAEGAVFGNAVTPAPAARPGATALHTGLHPLRNRVLFAEDVLGWHYPTLAELLVKEGYATGAFVSDATLADSSGLSQGFRVYDDDFSPVVSGLLRLDLARHLLGDGDGRAAGPTVDRFDAWLAGKLDYPFFAWVHLPAEGADAAIQRILDAVEPVRDETFIVITATHGTPVRTDGGLYDDRVRVPLLVRLPGVGKPVRVPQQVRLMDLSTTATTWLGVEAKENEGVDLAGFLDGRRSQTIGCTLVGRAPDGTVQLGLRNNGVKFVSRPGTPGGQLYRLEDDPGEQHDLAADQPEALEQAERILAPDSVRLEKLLR
ncbi:MAG: sulfatase-like hydrolase/transferase [Myxococcales bacterium]|nr:sulfatase-like hydrolase/transferase [Myxococcales bacterium]